MQKCTQNLNHVCSFYDLNYILTEGLFTPWHSNAFPNVLFLACINVHYFKAAHSNDVGTIFNYCFPCKISQCYRTTSPLLVSITQGWVFCNSLAKADKIIVDNTGNSLAGSKGALFALSTKYNKTHSVICLFF